MRRREGAAADPALAVGALVVPARRRDVPLLRPAHPDLDRAAGARMDRRVPSATQALARLRALWLPVAQAALAATLAWWLAHEVIGHRNAFFAPIAALIALGVGVSNRPRRVVELTLGVAVGIGVGGRADLGHRDRDVAARADRLPGDGDRGADRRRAAVRRRRRARRRCSSRRSSAATTRRGSWTRSSAARSGSPSSSPCP